MMLKAGATAITAALAAGALFLIWTDAPPASHGASPATTAATPPSPATPSPTARALRSSAPTSLEIPAIGVRTPLMSLAKNSDGTIEVPPLSRADEAGWYRLGPAPGSKGPAVIVGHVDTKSGPAVFSRLGELRRGQEIRIAREDGKTVVFQVDRLERVSKARFPTRKVYGSIPFAGLRLITCGGRFDPTSGHYEDNIIVYAHLIRRSAVASG